MTVLYVEFIECTFCSTICGFSLLFDWFVGYRHSLTYTVVKLFNLLATDFFQILAHPVFKM